MRQQLRRLCRKCDEMYQPNGKFQKMCDKCKRFSDINKGIRIWIQKGEVILKKNHKFLIDKENTYLIEELQHLNKMISQYL